MSIHVDVEKSTEIFKAKLGVSHIYSVDSNPIRKIITEIGAIQYKVRNKIRSYTVLGCINHEIISYL